MSTSTDTITTIEDSLFKVAEIAGDISPQIYQEYFARCEGSEELMQHIEDSVKGSMMAEVFRLLLEEDLSKQSQYLRFETKTHLAYGVETVMYENLFMAVLNTVKNLSGTSWTQNFEQAWQQRIQDLLQAVHIASEANSAA